MTKTTLSNLIVAAAIFVVVVGVVAVAFWRVLNDSQTLEQQITAVAAQNQQEETLLRMQRIAQSSENQRAELASYFLLRESDSISFLSDIETVAPTLGLVLETTNLRQINENNKEWIEATFSVGGRRDDVQEFVQIMENIPYVSRLKSVSMLGSRDGVWQAEVIIQVQLLTYAE